MKNNEDRNDNGRLTRKHYGKELSRLQLELCKLQDWVKYKGLRVIVVFEGRDAAGKGGTIRAITERVSPRVFRLVALPAPSDREKGDASLRRSNAADSQPNKPDELISLALSGPAKSEFDAVSDGSKTWR